jgi:cysteinyl-tRNA synthetase
MIALLIERGHAYAAEGHVLFAVTSYPEYGALARRSLDDMRAGARVEIAPYKRDPMDFVLWKPSTPDVPGWDSPWGRGRPGWHIECSAMARALLGGTFDVHGGGVDLAFPHHENELAQSACAHPDEGFARIWMHNGMLNVEGEKMSKSLGNFFTVRDLLDRGIPGEVIRFVLLSTHYRQPIDWTESKVEESRRTLAKWAALTEGAAPVTLEPGDIDALADDLNTPSAIAAMHEAARAEDGGRLLAMMTLMGIEARNPSRQATAAERRTVEALLDARRAAREARDFGRADALRQGLTAAGVKVMDRPGAPSDWEPGPDFDPAKLEALK